MRTTTDGDAQPPTSWRVHLRRLPGTEWHQRPRTGGEARRGGIHLESGADRRERDQSGDGAATREEPGALARELARFAVQLRSLASEAASRSESGRKGSA